MYYNTNEIIFKNYFKVVFSLLFFVSIKAYTQGSTLDKKITIIIENKSISDVLKEIEVNENYFFSYDKSTIKTTINITKSFVNISLRSVLDSLFEGYKMYYKAEGKHIVIRNYVKKVKVKGKILDSNGTPVPFASIILKNTNYGTSSKQNGGYSFYVPEGNYTIYSSCIGFETNEKKITINGSKTREINFVLNEGEVLKEVIISGKSKLAKTKALAYNVDVLDAKKLHSTTLDLGQALAKVSGVNVRENGGVGSKMNLSLNGFIGNQVKFFMDGIPIDNLGSSFQLNNIPISMADRIEVYKGVIPIWLGGDALGGAVNIVTNNHNKTNFNASYSYGSFNTHKSSVAANYVSKSGFITTLNAFQSYSDNNYWVDVDIANIKTGRYYKDQRVRRFHNTYHNETIILDFGVINKSYADKLLFGITLGKNYSEIQTGARIVSVFGDWYTTGNIVMPSLKYKKNNFFIKGLDLVFNANYNFGKEQNIDIKHRRYNWFGNFKEYNGVGGERSYSMYQYKNNNGLIQTNLSYNFNKIHKLSLNNVFNTFNRKGSDELYPNNNKYIQPRTTIKNITGLGYQIEYKKWNSSFFVKNYLQNNTFSQAYNPSGNWGNIAYKPRKNNFHLSGYGLASTFFKHKNFQLKTSFEKSYRLPESEELYGDVINLSGNIDLRPETSNNYNLGVTYWTNQTKSNIFNISNNVFYRNAKDFIRPRLDRNQAEQIMDNIADVTNLGTELEIRYSFLHFIKAGFNVTYQELRNNTKFEGNQTVESIVYRDRIPNTPYLFGNADISCSFDNPLNKKDRITIGYDLMYVHEFYLYWPSLGKNKLNIPTQLSQNIKMNYIFGKRNNYQFTFECRNLTNKNLYDNFSLPKPSRSFSGKIKYTFK